jgi:Ca2+-binding RTX toxin-like protein
VRVRPRAKFVRNLCLSMVGSVAYLWIFVPVPTIAAPDPLCLGVTATLVGTDGPDILVGTTGKNVIFGGGGDDVIHRSGWTRPPVRREGQRFDRRPG